MKLLNREFSQRLFITLAILLVVILFIYYAFVAGMFYLISAVILLLAILATKEYIQLTQAKASINKSVMVLSSIFIVLSFSIGCVVPQLLFLPALVLFVAMLVIFITHFKTVEGAIADISVTFFGIIYISVPLGMILSILYFKDQGQGFDGRFWIAYLISVTKISDIGAYLIGRLFGKKKLIVKLSPSKTFEGSIGGFIASVGLSLYFHWLLPEQITLFTSLILGIFLAIFSQIGDLSESLLKRDAQIKDSSSIPGIGGILDLLDSIFINTPILYFFFLF